MNTKIKLSILLFAVILGSGCGRLDRKIAGFTGKPAEVCVDGVSYLQFTSGAAVKVDPSGKPVACK